MYTPCKTYEILPCRDLQLHLVWLRKCPFSLLCTFWYVVFCKHMFRFSYLLACQHHLYIFFRPLIDHRLRHSRNLENEVSIIHFLCVSVYLQATGHSFWPRNLIFFPFFACGDLGTWVRKVFFRLKKKIYDYMGIFRLFLI